MFAECFTFRLMHSFNVENSNQHILQPSKVVLSRRSEGFPQ